MRVECPGRAAVDDCRTDNGDVKVPRAGSSGEEEMLGTVRSGMWRQEGAVHPGTGGLRISWRGWGRDAETTQHQIFFK